MAGYNLDDKGGLFGGFGGIKSPAKIMKKGDGLEFKHLSSFNSLKADVSDVTDTSIRFQSKEKTSDKKFAVNDPIVTNFTSGGETYVINGDITNIHNADQLDVTIKVGKIEKLKDVKKSDKFSVSLPAHLKVIGITELIPASVKALSLSAVKLNAKIDIMMEDMIDVTVVLDKASKASFKGIIVRKNKLSDGFEYGIEIHEIGESNTRNIHHYINQIVFS